MPSGSVLVGVRVSPFVEKVARALMLKRIAFEEVHPRSYWEAARWNPQTGKGPCPRNQWGAALLVIGERIRRYG